MQQAKTVLTANPKIPTAPTNVVGGVDRKIGTIVDDYAIVYPSHEDKREPSSAVEEEKKVVLSKSGLRRILGGRKLNNLRTKMVLGTFIQGSSATAITTVVNVRPAAFSEFASFAALYDEFKVHGGTFKYNLYGTGQTNAIIIDGAVGYDPVDNAAYASTAGVLVASQHHGPVTVGGLTDASLASSAARTLAPASHTETGFYSFPFKCPKGAQMVSNNSQQVCTGNWCDTNISSSLGDYGYIKPYISAAGSTTMVLTYYLILDVEFRSRT